MGREGKFCIGQGWHRRGVVVEEGGFLAVDGFVEEDFIEVEVGMRMWVGMGIKLVGLFGVVSVGVSRGFEHDGKIIYATALPSPSEHYRCPSEHS